MRLTTKDTKSIIQVPKLGGARHETVTEFYLPIHKADSYSASAPSSMKLGGLVVYMIHRVSHNTHDEPRWYGISDLHLWTRNDGEF